MQFVPINTYFGCPTHMNLLITENAQYSLTENLDAPTPSHFIAPICVTL